MTVVLPFCSKDIAQALSLLEWCIQLGKCPKHDAVLVADSATQWSDCLKAMDLAKDCFKSAELISTEKPFSGWPAAANAMFRTASIHLAGRGQPFFWMEPDCVPLKAGWLDALEDEYRKCGRLFMGAHVRAESPLPSISVAGCAVYPARASEILDKCCQGPGAWDVQCSAFMVPQSANTNLIQHFWGMKDLAPTFVLKKTPYSPVNTFTLESLKPESVVFHRNKDGSLIRVLRERMFPHLVDNREADIVSLRRAGDIIILLPLLRFMAAKANRPIRLVVHRDFVPLLECASYVEPVAWDGDWEDALLAAQKHHARNAQVFGRGLKPDTMFGNFAKLAWAALGQPWNRYLPLILDKRDVVRERTLAAKVFQTDKPKILVKLNGNSSPCGEANFIREKLKSDFQDAELVWLDDVQAERVYDLVGLMDRAACLVSVDTVTLWLAHASRCPLIQFVNNGHFGATPPRGNCLLRLPYSQIPSQWHKISRVIRSTLCTPANEEMVLAFSDFTPSDPDTIRRQNAAYQTWPLLGARLFSFRGNRSSKIIKDNRDMPFVRDMIEGAMASGTESIIIIANNDIQVDARLRKSILQSCHQWGCWWSYRTDGPGGKTDQGADLFAFTRCWWACHQHLFPDFLLGYWWWDDMMVRLMQWSGCREQERLYYHQPHKGVEDRLFTTGAMHNNNLALHWLKEHDEDRQKPNVHLSNC